MAEKIKKQVVATIGRWMPVHNGHKAFLVELAQKYDKVVVMIGSAYKGEDIRYCITATEREKMIRAIYKAEGISEKKFIIVPVDDKPTFEEWLSDVFMICEKYKVTHFCTGNQEDILDVLKQKGIPLSMYLINPEVGSSFPYHATDIRNMIIHGDYETLEKLIPNETKPILFRYTFQEILAASQNQGISFVKGRQTVDMIILIRNCTDGKLYVLLGNRPSNKRDFRNTLALPGGSIHKFETAIQAAIRNFRSETGLSIKMVDNSLEPAIVKWNQVPQTSLQQMHMVGIYGSNDIILNGTQGGSSQCFAILVEDDLKKFEGYIRSSKGLKNVKFYDVQQIEEKQLAYQHKDMLQKAIWMLKAIPDFQRKLIR